MTAQKISTTDALKTASKMVIQQTAEAKSYLIRKKNVEKITKAASKSAREASNKSMPPTKIEETLIQPIEILKQIYIPPKGR